MKRKKKRIGSCARKLISRIQDKLKKAKGNETQSNRKLERKSQEGWIEKKFERRTREGWINGEIKRRMREGWIEGDVELKTKEQCRINDELGNEKQDQCRSNSMIECGRREMKMGDGDFKCEVQEQCRNNGELGESMEEQAKGVDKNHQRETQTRNKGVRMRTVMVGAMMIAVTTIAVFQNGVVVGSHNEIA